MEQCSFDRKAVSTGYLGCCPESSDLSPSLSISVPPEGTSVGWELISRIHIDWEHGSCLPLAPHRLRYIRNFCTFLPIHDIKRQIPSSVTLQKNFLALFLLITGQTLNNSIQTLNYLTVPILLSYCFGHIGTFLLVNRKVNSDGESSAPTCPFLPCSSHGSSTGFGKVF